MHSTAELQFAGVRAFGNGDDLEYAIRVSHKQKPCEVLLALIAERDETAFVQLYRRMRAQLVSQSAAILAGDVSAAEDAVDEAFLDIWRKAGKFKGNGSGEGWVRRIVRNKSVDLVRRQARLVCNGDDDLTHSHTDPDHDPEQSSVINCRKRTIATAFESLSPSHREVIQLFYFAEFSIDHIAATISVPAGTVKSRLHHARMALLKKLKPIGMREDDF